METINDNIRQLLEMLDNPEAYTEQEIQDIINRDEDTRECSTTPKHTPSRKSKTSSTVMKIHVRPTA